MVGLDIVRASNAKLIASQPLVAVFVGGTSGIGSYTYKVLAKLAKDGPGLRAYVVGRNESSANEIIAECCKSNPNGDFRFVKADDIGLLKDVDRVCAEISRLEEEEATKNGGKPRIDLLIMTQAYLAFEARKETAEGIDQLMSLLYYSRIRLIENFIPLLQASSLPAHVISVFGPQRDGKLHLNDLSLRNPQNYSFNTMCSHVAYLKTFYFEHLAAQHPTIAFTHYFPNLVITAAFTAKEANLWFRVLWRFVGPLAALVAVGQEECARRVLFLASDRFPARGNGKREGAEGVGIAESSDGMSGGGAYRVNWNGENIAVKKNYQQLRADGAGEKFVKHTQELLKSVDAGEVFKN